MAIVDGEKRLTLLDLYNDITGQAWSMFDSDVEGEDEFEQSVITSIQKSLSELWNSFKYPFRERTHLIITKSNKNSYSLPESATANNIMKISYNGKSVYSIFCDGMPLKHDPNCKYAELKNGKPKYFYIQQEKLYVYPVPDDSYMITVDYMSIYPALSKDGDEKATLEEETDYINIPEQYQELFKVALMPLTMWNYLIASESDENSEAYKIQYDKAYKILIQNVRPIDYDKTIGWRS